MTTIRYALTETVVRVKALSVTVTDPYVESGNARTHVEDLTVEVADTADHNDEVTVELVQGSREISATLRPDGRLQSLEYNSVGVGTQVVTGVAKVIAFLGSIAAAVVRGGRPAEQKEGEQPPAESPADVDWKKEHAADEQLRTDYLKIHADASSELAKIRGLIVTTVEPAALRTLHARASAVERVASDAASEIARFVKAKAAWREGKRTTTKSELQTVVRFADIGRRVASGLDAPTVPDDGPRRQLWDEFGLLLEQRHSTRETAEPTMKVPSSKSESSEVVEQSDNGSDRTGTHVIWRVPRETELWIWKRDSEGKPELVRRETIAVATRGCEERSMRLTTAIFGEHGGALTFNDDGLPASIMHKQQSAIGSAFDAFAAVPEAVAGAVGHAKSAAEAFVALRDLEAERAQAAAERELDIAKKQLELSGIHATADQYAELQRAEQAVALQTAKRSLSPSAAALDDLKRELDIATTRTALAAERRTAELDAELAELRADVARLQLEAAKANPTPPAPAKANGG